MDEKYANARDHFFAAIRTLAASTDSIQTRLIDANVNILHVTIDEFDGDMELKVKFAKILDLLAIDQDDMETVAVETAAHMTDFEAVKVADLICDFTMSLHRGVSWEDGHNARFIDYASSGMGNERAGNKADDNPQANIPSTDHAQCRGAGYPRCLAL